MVPNPCAWLSRPEGKVVKKVALIGKGLTFDSGGYNIKVSRLENHRFEPVFVFVFFHEKMMLTPPL